MISEAAIVDALRGVRDPSLDRDIVTLKFVKDLAIDGGRVAFTLETATAGRSPERPAGRRGARTMRGWARRAANRA